MAEAKKTDEELAAEKAAAKEAEEDARAKKVETRENTGVTEHAPLDARTAMQKRGVVAIGNYKMTVGGKQVRVAHGTPIEGLPPGVKKALKDCGAKMKQIDPDDDELPTVGKPTPRGRPRIVKS